MRPGSLPRTRPTTKNTIRQADNHQTGPVTLLINSAVRAGSRLTDYSGYGDKEYLQYSVEMDASSSHRHFLLDDNQSLAYK